VKRTGAKKPSKREEPTNPARINPRASSPDVSSVDDPALAHITPGLRSLAVPLESLRLDPRNARRHGERNQRSIKYSLEKFGQQKPISVDADGIILAGNGTYEQAKALGWTHIAAVRSELRGVEARAFAIADNRTGELAEWDAEELAAQLEEIEDAAAGIDMARLEITNEELDALLSDGEAPAGGAKGSGSGSGGGDVGEAFKIVVDCRSEAHQATLLRRFKTEGLPVRALIG
jgi:hypothetical protein